MHRIPPANAQLIGILNLVFGVVGALPWLLLLLGGGLLTALGGAFLGAGSAPAGGALGLAGGMVMIIAVIGMALSVLLLASGVGILQLAPWGRTLGLVYAWASVLLQAWTLITSGFGSGLCSLLGLVYPIVLLVVLNRDDWKEAFR